MRGVVIAAALLGLSGGLSGCSLLSSQESTENTAATQSLQFLFENTPAAPDLATLQQFPYPVTYVQFEGAPRTILVLAATGNHGQYWFSAGDEALTLWQGRIIRSSALERENRVHTDQLHNDPLACYLKQPQQAEQQQQQQQQNCSSSWQRSIQIQRPTARYTPHDPQHEIVTLQVQSEFQRDGRDITEQGTATEYVAGKPVQTHDFSNSYRLSTDNMYVISSKQWLSPQHGYVELEMVNLARPIAPRGEAEVTRFQVSVTPEAQPRLRHFVEAMQQHFYPDSYWPGLRIHSDELDERFAGRHTGMLKRLRMLAEIYQHDGDSELEQAARQLAEQFQQWPMRASYIHGLDPAKMRSTLEHNPVLNARDAEDAYEVVLAAASSTQVGVSNLTKTERWLIQPNGTIRELEPREKLNDGQPGIVLTSIAESDLPQGFRDINAQLAMFLQHWDFSQ
ncbi:YjbF family lipoprotein [Pseudidiomarina terrestris]|uniref:YjbF family lipoprotein n=1 Tax=Pseudidiomarina terrestris TaxID=2820060 RepID=UPI00264B1AFE|nr:YjbF family lipoprotein [Pseudidiomarina sp. 1ASP75-5]MDN7134526.1 YjbF family lipoprotein [Pseudidiomarina sp. 1ASP75-5]